MKITLGQWYVLPREPILSRARSSPLLSYRLSRDTGSFSFLCSLAPNSIGGFKRPAPPRSRTFRTHSRRHACTSGWETFAKVKEDEKKRRRKKKEDEKEGDNEDDNEDEEEEEVQEGKKRAHGGERARSRSRRIPNVGEEDAVHPRESSGEICDTVNLQREAKYAVHSLPPPPPPSAASSQQQQQQQQ